MNCYDLTIHQAHQLLKKRELSSLELTRAVLERITRVEKKVHAFVTVTEDEALHQAEMRICHDKGIKWVSLPMSSQKPPMDFQVIQWLKVIRDPRHHPVLVHCTHGVNRTGMLVTVYEAEINGKDARQAFLEQPTFGHDWDESIEAYFLEYPPETLDSWMRKLWPDPVRSRD